MSTVTNALLMPLTWTVTGFANAILGDYSRLSHEAASYVKKTVSLVSMEHLFVKTVMLVIIDRRRIYVNLALPSASSAPMQRLAHVVLAMTAFTCFRTPASVAILDRLVSPLPILLVIVQCLSTCRIDSNSEIRTPLLLRMVLVW